MSKTPKVQKAGAPTKAQIAHAKAVAEFKVMLPMVKKLLKQVQKLERRADVLLRADDRRGLTFPSGDHRNYIIPFLHTDLTDQRHLTPN